jgi:co-chaperonin GroES (HSP10)
MTNKLPLRVFHNDVLFQFEDEDTMLNDGKKSARGFKEKTDWGFVFSNAQESASNARWGKVVAVGPEVDPDIFVGRRILIENLKWTAGVEFERQTYWKTSDEVILGVDSTEDR